VAAPLSLDLPELKDQIVAVDAFNNDYNPKGCNRIKIHDINSKLPILWGNYVYIPAHLAANSDLSVIVGTVGGNKRLLFGFTRRARADGKWRSVFMSANTDWSAPIYVTRDDQDMIVPYVQGLGRQPLTDMYLGAIGTDYLSMGALPRPEKVIDGIHPAAVVDSLDARTLYVAADNGHLYRIDRESFQVIGEPLPYPVTDANTLEVSVHVGTGLAQQAG
jgi:hypothetical protein